MKDLIEKVEAAKYLRVSMTILDAFCLKNKGLVESDLINIKLLKEFINTKSLETKTRKGDLK